MRRRGKSGVAGFALVGCSALVLALGGCSGDSGSATASNSASAGGGGYSDVVQVTGTSTLLGGTTWKAESSDPRLNGESTSDPQCEFTEHGDRTIGYCTVTNKSAGDGPGGWEGYCTGTTTWTVTEMEHIHDFDCVLIGTGDYAGLRFREHIGGGDAMPWEFTGQIETFPASPSAS
jgi:hypothetical protein